MRELRVLASVPVILLFAGILAALLTGIFVLEAFVTQLYTGPGHKYIVCPFTFCPFHYIPETKFNTHNSSGILPNPPLRSPRS
jgi:hypothetical protein